MAHHTIKSVASRHEVPYINPKTKRSAKTRVTHVCLYEYRVQEPIRTVRGNVCFVAQVGEDLHSTPTDSTVRFLLREEDYDALVAAQKDGEIGHLSGYTLLDFLMDQQIIPIP